MSIFEYVSADLNIFRIFEQLDIIVYINANSDRMAYSGITVTVDIFSQFQSLLKSNSCIF